MCHHQNPDYVNNMKTEDLLRLQRNVESLSKEADRAEGALGGLKQILKTEFNCNTVAEAKHKLDRLRKKESKLGAKLKAKLEEFETKWNEKLEG